jgi:hypothetical protein
VFAINIGHPPPNYHAPTRPGHELGMLHPIPVGRAPREPGTWTHPAHEPRMIAGVLAEPIRPAANPNTFKDRAAASPVTRSDLAIDHVSRQPGPGVVRSNPSEAIRNDSRSATYRAAPPPPATVNGTVPPSRQMRPPPPPQNTGYPSQNPGYPAQRPSYPTQTQGEHPASRAYQPAYTPRPAPPLSPPPASRPMPPATPHLSPNAPAVASPK